MKFGTDRRILHLSTRHTRLPQMLHLEHPLIMAHNLNGEQRGHGEAGHARRRGGLHTGAELPDAGGSADGQTGLRRSATFGVVVTWLHIPLRTP
jgi:hypothetical protein